MKPLNHSDRVKVIRRFVLFFVFTIVVVFLCGIFTLVTADKGISLLISKKESYDNVFRKQAELNFKLDEIFKELYNLRTKQRSRGEHRQMQKLISDTRVLMEREVMDEKDSVLPAYRLYHELFLEISAVQVVLNSHKVEDDRRENNKSQLKKCQGKYRKLNKKRH